MGPSLGSIGDDWLMVVTIFSPALIPIIYVVGLWFAFRSGKEQ